jgi:hypothetical protein
VILDYDHNNQFELSELEPFTNALVARGASVETDQGNSTLGEQLKYASAYVVLSPTNDFNPAESQAVRNFVTSGGRLIVFTDPTRGPVSFDFMGNQTSSPDIDPANALLAPFDLTFNNDYLYNLDDNEGNFRNVIFTRFSDNPIVSGLKQVIFYGAHSVTSERGTPLAVGDDKVLTSLTDTGGKLSPIVLGANGQILAVGDFTFLMTPYNAVGDNATLLDRIADFAVGGTRTSNLADYPYVFSQEVHLLPTGDIQLTAELMSSLSALQGEIESTGQKFFIDEKPTQEGDLIVLGTFDPNDDIQPYIKPFKLELEAFNEYIDVPGFGKVGRSGNALVMFNPGSARNTLIVLANAADDMPTIITKLSSGDLSTCVLQGQIAVCSIGFGGSFLDKMIPTPEPTLVPIEVPGSVPSPTPTPVKP